MYLYLPGELLRVTPVLVLSAFPMAQNVVFPVALMFPNYLLSSHFYSEDQLNSAYFQEASHRQSYYRSILRDLMLMTPRNDAKFAEARQTVSVITEDKVTPSPETILSLVPLFNRGMCVSAQRTAENFAV